MFKDRIFVTLILVNLFLFLVQLSLIFLKISSLPNLIPVWYTNPWGQSQMGGRLLLLTLPAISLIISLINNYLALMLIWRKETLSAYCLVFFNILLQVILTVCLFRVFLIYLSSFTTWPWLIRPSVILTLTVSFIISLLFTLPVIKLAGRFGFIDNPQTHKHPAMLLTRSVPRAGALPLFLSLLLTSYFFVGWDKKILAVMMAGFVGIVLGIIDDKYDLNPYLRFGAQIICILIVIFGGVQIDYINHPSGIGVLPLTKIFINFGHNFSIQPLSFLLAFFWILWNMNMISWSNGVDGQFPLITTVAALVIGILGLSDVNQLRTSTIAFAVAGAALGTLPFSWYPSKILYGFGATAIGLVLSSLSILNGTKVATTLLVLLVPSLDAILTIVRRIRSGRSPFWGDRSHLHHKLLDLGLSHRQIALFYGLAGVLLGSISIVSSGQGKLIAIITASGGFVFFLTLLNYLPEIKNGKPQGD